MKKLILDACYGGRMFWFDKSNPDVEFCDNRVLPPINLCDGRIFEVNPDIVADFTALPFPDETFYLVVYDPPHLEKIGEKSYMALKYGKLGTDWQSELKKGFDECLRVLRPNGVLIFKWSETQITVKRITAIFGQEPLFGHKAED